jgi:miniconductance mechanosensitive channel
METLFAFWTKVTQLVGINVEGTEEKLSNIVKTDWSVLDSLRAWLISLGVNDLYADAVKLIIVFSIIVILALLADWVANRIFLAIVAKVAKRTETEFDDTLVKNKVFHRLANLFPGIVVFYSISLPLADYPHVLSFLHKTCEVYLVVVGVLAIMAFINSINEHYQTLPMSKIRSIKGYLQVIKIVLYVIETLLIISIIWNLNIGRLFTGLGAMAAVLMFVFKDSILGLVASIQLSANDMLRPGDWIEMPSRKADGVVTDISLTAVKVQNWDKTVTTIPTYSLVSDSFTNWRGMEEAEGRRFKKAINIDMKSIHFFSENVIERISNNPVIAKNFDVKAYLANSDNFISEKDPAHQTPTNLGLLRAYLEAYLTNMPIIHKEMTLLVHYLQPNENGLPVEIIAFSKEKAGKPYELLQSEIYDHILAILPEFDLKVFQRPTSFSSNE